MSQLKCPRCTVELQTAEQASLCPQCEGCWFDNRVLNQVLHGPDLESSPFAATLQAEDHGLDLESPIKCPTCDKVLARFEYGGNSRVFLDTCSEHGVWLDDGELGGLLKYLSRENRRYERGPRHKPVPGGFAGWLGSLFRSRARR